GRRLAPGLVQLTGTHLQKGQTVHTRPELPDPSPPFVAADGSVEVYGSALHYIRFQNWDVFARGGPFELVDLDLRYPAGAMMSNVYGHPWDVLKARIRYKTSTREILIAGSMSPTGGRARARWPHDNVTRRLFAFECHDGVWTRHQRPLFGDPHSGWVGHCYGGNLYQRGCELTGEFDFASEDPAYLFYERVTEGDRERGPRVTELFARRLYSLERAGAEVKILGAGDPPWPSTRRTIGGTLVEGPRPVRMSAGGEEFYVLGFSSGDFPTDKYALNWAWSREILGPYEPALTSDGADLADLGHDVREQFHLSWTGRPVFYQTPEGSWEMMFHGVHKAVLPENDYKHWPERYKLWEFYRCLFKARLKVTFERGRPCLALDLHER
ncbi:MAG TPA: hypothetical protein VFV50_01805, partial [Bdellovibrionales bacterium]|nr:hypothetical protein [Bdellovibrionales bacterium]